MSNCSDTWFDKHLTTTYVLSTFRFTIITYISVDHFLESSVSARLVNFFPPSCFSSTHVKVMYGGIGCLALFYVCIFGIII